MLPLGEAVQSRLEQRRDRMGRRFFKDTYSTGLHREKLIALLEPIVAGRTEESYEVSLVFQGVIDGGDLEGDERRREWLSAFFEDAPEWETTLREWIAEMRRLRG